jgi:GntR family transcriptional regulator/MocR family aminotransferase
MNTTFSAELLLPIDRASTTPLHIQLEREMRRAVRTGRLPADLPLPSTRALASNLGLSRGVVVECYEQLIAEGYFTSVRGSGTRVAAIRTEARSAAVTAPVAVDPRYDFRPGTPDVGSFPRREWFASLRRVYNAAGSRAFRYPGPRGPLTTRTALASFLGRSRATVGDEDCIVLCNGFAQGIDLMTRLLQSRGVRSIAVEDPGYGSLAQRLSNSGIATTCVPVDERGLVVERLARTSAKAVVVTPAHQYPTGAGMTPDRRAALLAWAAKRDAWIIEDDYDAEFRYDREPLGALQGLAPDRVVYVGTGSKILSPALRLGWLMAPEAVAAELASLKQLADGGSPTFDQLALADFIDSGQMDRHLRRMRQVYRRRRDLLTAALSDFLPDLRIGGVAAGLHLMLSLPAGTNENALLASAAERSIRVFGAAQYRARPRHAPPAIVIGYGCIAESLVREGVQQLAGLIRRTGR